MTAFTALLVGAYPLCAAALPASGAAVRISFFQHDFLAGVVTPGSGSRSYTPSTVPESYGPGVRQAQPEDEVVILDYVAGRPLTHKEKEA